MKSILSIDIDEHWLKISGGNSSRARFVKQKVIVKKITGLSDLQISQIIEQYVKDFKLKSKAVILSVPRNQVAVRNQHYPSQNIDEIEQMIELNVGRIVPYSRDEIIYSYRHQGLDDRGYSKVMICIIHQNIIKRLVAIIEMAGCFIEAIRLSSYGAYSNVLTKFKKEICPGSVNLLLDMDFKYVDFMIFSDQDILYSLSISIDSDQIVEDIGITKLIGEIRQSLVIFNSKGMNCKPSAVYISGGQSNADKLVANISSELDLPVTCVVLDCQKDESFPKNLSVTSVADFSLGREDVECLEFSMPEIQIRQMMKKKMKDIVFLASLSVYFMLVLGGYVYGRIYNQERYLSKLKTWNAELFMDIGDVITKSNNNDFVKKFLEHRKIPFYFLGRLVEVMPKEIAVKYLNVDKNFKVVLRGEAEQLSDIFRFVSILEKEEQFIEVQTKYTRKRKAGNSEFADFELVFQLDIQE